MKRYNLSDEAKQDLVDIRAYLTRESGAPTARYVLKRIKDGMDFLSRTPGAGHSREDLTDATVKFWSVFSYLIIYKATTRPIGIVRVVHGSREITSAMLSTDD
jgi:toxin ParE1/3/4